MGGFQCWAKSRVAAANNCDILFCLPLLIGGPGNQGKACDTCGCGAQAPLQNPATVGTELFAHDRLLPLVKFEGGEGRAFAAINFAPLLARVAKGSTTLP